VGTGIDARSVNLNTVNMHNDQKILHQQMDAAYNMQTGSSSSGLKRPGDPEEVLANSSKRPGGGAPGAGGIMILNRKAEQFDIGDDTPNTTPPPLPPPDGPPLSLYQIAVRMLERERVEREQAGMFASVGKEGERGRERKEKAEQIRARIGAARPVARDRKEKKRARPKPPNISPQRIRKVHGERTLSEGANKTSLE